MESDAQTRAADHPLLRTVQQRLGGRLLGIEQRHPNRVWLEIPPEHVLEACGVLFSELGGRLATASGVDLRDAVEVNYHFAFDAQACVVTVKTRAPKPDPHLPSLAPLIAGANWIEREINDLIGCRFVGHPNLERLILADDWPEGVHPLSREFA